MPQFYRFIPFLLFFILAACGGGRTTPAPVVPVGGGSTTSSNTTAPTTTALTPPPEIGTATAIPAPQAQPSNSAVVALLDDAKQQSSQGDYQAAQGSLQRAQRIAPQNPEVYYELAETNMQLQNYSLAEQVALKGVSVSQGRNAQLKRFWHLIADIRVKAGNSKGAAEAFQKYKSFQVNQVD